MYTVLLSGGSGKRLWPLSNDYRSKQYIKLFETDGATNQTEKVSMVQRVFGQLSEEGLLDNSMICASQSQVEVIKSQLGEVCIAVEPERRNTFAAVVISCAYAVTYMGAGLDDIITILPVDPYTDKNYFSTISKLGEHLEKSCADIALMGAIPDVPSTKYGYILPETQMDGYYTVKSFREKPDLKTAEELIKSGAVFNCGVFCFHLEFIKNVLDELNLPLDYDFLYANYDRLPKISFDYQILEKAKNMIFVPFKGYWKDIGTWNTLASELRDATIGNVIIEDCKNTNVINMLDIPIVTYGINNSVIVASADGILVAEKDHTESLRDLVNQIDMEPMFEECSWGQSEIIKNMSEYKIKHISVGGYSTFESVTKENESIIYIVLSGNGKYITSNKQKSITKGDIIELSARKSLSLMSENPMKLLEIKFNKEDMYE